MQIRQCYNSLENKYYVTRPLQKVNHASESISYVYAIRQVINDRLRHDKIHI